MLGEPVGSAKQWGGGKAGNVQGKRVAGRRLRHPRPTTERQLFMLPASSRSAVGCAAAQTPAWLSATDTAGATGARGPPPALAKPGAPLPLPLPKPAKG